MNKYPKVSIIIPTYNTANYLAATIDSAIHQSFTDYEIIVIDDGSTDETETILDKYKNNIRVHKQLNQGPGAARNVGIQIANGENLVFLDSDDLLHSGMLAIQTAYLDRNSDVDVVYSNGYRFKEDKKGHVKYKLLSKSGEVVKIPLDGNPADYLISHNCFPPCVAMVRKRCVIEIGCFDESLTTCEDWDLWFRIACNYKISFVNGIAAYYRVRKGSNSDDKPRNIREHLRVMKKIEQSEFFKNANETLRSEFYYVKGILSLFIGEKENARLCFNTSVDLNRSSIKAQSAQILFKLFGVRLKNIYRAKRIIFGIHGIHPV
ncbi:MAG TPA: glycosyltransferase [Anaerolineaceae bacterium]|nr:glycosyltransferase [Anaerolineaceae bacterium]